MPEQYTSALIVGAGTGLSASVARVFSAAGMRIALAARSAERLAALARETKASLHRCDATDRAQVEGLFDALVPAPDVVLYNASYRVRGPFVDLDPREVARAIEISAFGAFLVAQAAVRRMLPRGRGAVLFTGASASVKGYARSAPFAMGKFAPLGIHVAHFVIDGGIRSARRTEPPDKPDSLIDPDAVAQTYLHVLQQPRSAWSWEVALRPWVETF